jgi:hypothetical protein
MSRKSSSYTADRRTFLKKLAAAGGATAAVAVSGAAGGATAAVAVSGRAAVASPVRDEASEPAREKGYHETPHIRSYYRSARL